MRELSIIQLMAAEWFKHEERFAELYKKYDITGIVDETWDMIASSSNPSAQLGGLEFLVDVGIIIGSKNNVPTYLKTVMTLSK